MTEILKPDIKKRGRKKIAPISLDNPIENSPPTDNPVSQTNDCISQPKKRGRKARGAKLIVKNDENLLTKVVTASNVILHLKCCLVDLNEYNNEINKMVSDPLTYNPIVPPDIANYNEIPTIDGFSKFTSYHEDEETIRENNDKNETSILPIKCCCQENTQLQTKELNLKLKKLKISLYKNNIPIDKVSACFWCTYDFDNLPCYIPKHEANDTIISYGSFCRPECAVAYLFKENIDDSTKFERYQLLNNIYGKVYDYTKNIKPAPDPHYLLDKFYGQLSIQEYRKLLKTQHSLLVIEKPMTRILPELHDDNNEDISNQGSKTGIYKVKRESDKEQSQSKTSIIRNKFGLT
jgi:thiamine pyrophosphokinase